MRSSHSSSTTTLPMRRLSLLSSSMVWLMAQSQRAWLPSMPMRTLPVRLSRSTWLRVLCMLARAMRSISTSPCRRSIWAVSGMCWARLSHISRSISALSTTCRSLFRSHLPILSLSTLTTLHSAPTMVSFCSALRATVL